MKFHLKLDHCIPNNAFYWLHEQGRECMDWQIDPEYYKFEDGESSSDIEYDNIWFKTEEMMLMYILKWI
jgi:hypothetical protein